MNSKFKLSNQVRHINGLPVPGTIVRVVDVWGDGKQYGYNVQWHGGLSDGTVYPGASLYLDEVKSHA